MNKLKQIEALVEEAAKELGLLFYKNGKPYCSHPQFKTLTDLAKRAAEIDEKDFNDCWQQHSREPVIITRVKTYNSRLRGKVKEELHPAIQHVNVEGELTPEIVKAINKLAEVAYNTPIKLSLIHISEPTRPCH
jgi:hypothetical protein